jgi:hypothetical protein
MLFFSFSANLMDMIKYYLGVLFAVSLLSCSKKNDPNTNPQLSFSINGRAYTVQGDLQENSRYGTRMLRYFGSSSNRYYLEATDSVSDNKFKWYGLIEARTYESNNKGSKFIHKDVSNLKPVELKKLLPIFSCELFYGV